MLNKMNRTITKLRKTTNPLMMMKAEYLKNRSVTVLVKEQPAVTAMGGWRGLKVEVPLIPVQKKQCWTKKHLKCSTSASDLTFYLRALKTSTRFSVRLP
jgi:hypothetical protein